MAEIKATMVKELREKTGAGMMECKKALQETEGDFQKATNLLRERGEAKVLKRGERQAKEGLIVAHLSTDARTGALIELNSETDFVARNDEFVALAKKLAEHAATGVPAGTDINASSIGGQTVEDEVKGAAVKIGEKLALSRSERFDSEDGVVVSYIHPPGKIGVLIEVTTSKPELAKDPEFLSFARGIAMHVAATNPICLTRDQIPSASLENEKVVYRNQALNEGKPEKILDKIVEGRVSKYYSEVCLLEQPYVQDPDQKVENVVKTASGKFGDVKVKRFVRYQLGETAKAEEAEAQA